MYIFPDVLIGVTRLALLVRQRAITLAFISKSVPTSAAIPANPYEVGLT